MNNQKIKVCYNHDNYRVPLIWTFKFISCEYWCPYCGYTGGMFGSGTDVRVTPKLIKRHELYKEAAKEFLSSDDLDWEYERKAESLMISDTDDEPSVASKDASSNSDHTIK